MDDNYVRLCYDTVKSNYGPDELFVQFLSFLPYKKDDVINEQSVHQFLQNGNECEVKSKEWAAHFMDSMYEEISSYTVRQLTDENEIPEEIAELLPETLAQAYAKFKRFEKKYRAKSNTLATTDQTAVQSLITTQSAVVVHQNKQQGKLFKYLVS